MDSDKADDPYPHFGLRECRHREIRHNPLECGELSRVAVALERWPTKLLNPPFNPKKRSG